MSVLPSDAEELLSELIKRNQHNQLIINGYQRFIRKRYERFLTSTRELTSKTEAVSHLDPPKHQLNRHLGKLKHKESFDIQLSQPMKDDSTDSKLPFNFASKQKKEEFRHLLRLGRDIKGNPGQKKSLNKDSDLKLPEARAPLHLKNIIFQQLNEKLARQSKWKRTDKKRQSCLGSFPVLFVERSSLPNQNDQIDKI